ncbi:sensor histidine kinase [Geoalkalibacter sp.]|uniref:sensor histidine kinase n=1 Tax=Geoalkalibacter sp. TaxID=3041440 RepID=UPI00272E41EF|nr:ATP-binding protein [Geoalkalibacter sp.]
MKPAAASLVTKVILFNMVLLVIGIGSFTLFHLHRERQHLLDVTRQHAAVLLSTVERSIANAMCTGNTQEVQTILELVGGSPHLLRVRLFHPDGRVQRSSHPEEVGQAVAAEDLNLFRGGRKEALFAEGEDEWISILLPIHSAPACIACHDAAEKVLGVLNLHVSMAETRDQLRATTALFSVSTLVMLVVLAGGISWVLLRFVQRPLRDLTGQMARVEQGDLKARARPFYNDEVGRLAHGFNAMVDKLERARQDLQDYHFHQMERADRLASIGEMATGVAHEIKNPLAGISAAISVLAESFDGNDERKAIVGEVLVQIARLNKTATDLLHFGRPAPPEPSYVDINDLIGRTLFFAAQHPEAGKVRRELCLAKNLPPVHVDEKQIQQVLFNVVINAMQAMTEGGILRVSTESVEQEGGEWILVKIADSGPGIPAEQQEQIFTPFFTTKTQGTGLGLSICRRLLEQHKGRILLDSRPGQGTTFTIALPAAAMGGDDKGEDIRGQA